MSSPKGQLTRRQMIKKAARERFRQASFEDVTIHDIARHAGVGEATIYRYFQTKENLFTQIYGDLLDLAIDQIERSDRSTAAKGPGSNQLEAWLLDRVLAVYRQRSQFYAEEPRNGARYLRSGFQTLPTSSNRNMAQGDRIIALVQAIILQSRHVDLAADTAHLVAQNCHAAFMHEVDRESARGLAASTHWARLEPRLRAQLEPLLLQKPHP